MYHSAEGFANKSNGGWYLCDVLGVSVLMGSRAKVAAVSRACPMPSRKFLGWSFAGSWEFPFSVSHAAGLSPWPL